MNGQPISSMNAGSELLTKARCRSEHCGMDRLAQARQLYCDNLLEEAGVVLRPLVDTSASDGLPLPQQAEALQLYGLILHDLGRPTEGADALERASLVKPLREISRIALASCYAELGRVDLARELYLQLALNRELPPDLMLQVAAGLEAIDSPQLAMQVCEWITERGSEYAQAYYDMGYYSARSGKPLYLTEALTMRAVKLDPGNVHYRIGLVSLLIQLEREDEALAALGEIGAQDIRGVTCETCLGRIADLLDRHVHSGLAGVCRERVAEIAARRIPSPISRGNVQ